MFLLYHSDGCNTSETVFNWFYVNDLHTTHTVVCWVTARLLGTDRFDDSINQRGKLGVNQIGWHVGHGRRTRVGALQLFSHVAGQDVQLISSSAPIRLLSPSQAPNPPMLNSITLPVPHPQSIDYKINFSCSIFFLLCDENCYCSKWYCGNFSYFNTI
jgi:hypothetical protein